LRAARLARAAGFVFPDRFFGFLGSGQNDLTSLLAKIEALGPGLTELCFHPATGGGLPRADFAYWGHYDWDKEHAALVHPSAREALTRSGITLVHFGDLTAQQR